MSNFEKNMEPIIAKEDMEISSEEKKASQDQDKEPIANKEGVEMKNMYLKWTKRSLKQ